MTSKARNIADLGSNDVIETTATGVDVTGTVTADAADIAGAITADGLTVDGNVSFNTTAGDLDINPLGGASVELDCSGTLGLKVGGTSGFHVTNNSDESLFKAELNGDVSFYEDTGTTAKMVWDASEEQLSITGSVSGKVPFRTFSGGYTADYNSYTAEEGFQVMSYQSDGGSPYTKTSDLIANADGTAPSEIRLLTKANGASNPTERMRIDSSGNVGIGTPNPNISGFSRALTIDSSESGIELSSSGTVNTLIASNAQGANIQGIGSSGIRLFTSASGSTTERARINSSGNLLVGKTSSNGRKLEVAGEFDYKVATFSAGSSTDILLGVAGSAVVTLMVDVANTQNDNSHASYLLFATTRFSGYGGGNAVNVVSSAHNSTGVSTEPSGITFSIVASGNNIYLRVSGTTVGGTGTLRVQVREIGMQ